MFFVHLSLLFLFVDPLNGNEKAETRIVGGHRVTIYDFPYLVSVHFNRRPLCGGSIVTFKWILTAAHCMIDDSNNMKSVYLFSIVAGATELSKADEMWDENIQKRNVKKAIVHEDYRRGYMLADVALLYLSSALNESPATQKVRFYEGPLEGISENGYDTVNGTCIGVGWGSQNKYDPDVRSQSYEPSDHLLATTLNLIDQWTCSQKYLESLIETGHLCTLTPGSDTCQGDSGGPLLCYENGHNNRLIQSGIVSFGIGCGSYYPGVYVAIVYYRDFIFKTVRNESANMRCNLFIIFIVLFFNTLIDQI